MTDMRTAAKIANIPLPGSEMPERVRALIVDDNEIDRQQLHAMCRATDLSMDVFECDGVESLAGALDARRYDVVFIDYRLTDGDGLEALEIVQSHADNGEAAPIMIAGEAHVDVAVTALKNGCWDYIYKDSLQVPTLRRSIVTAIHRAAMRRDLFDAEQRRALLATAVRQLAEHSANDMRPTLEKMRRKLAAMRLQLRRGSIPESEAHLVDLENVWQRLALFLDQVESANHHTR